MKKTILIFGIIFFLNKSYAQFLPAGVIISNDVYRAGGIGIGYSTLPVFGTNKFMVNGNTSFFGNLRIDQGSISVGNQFTPNNDVAQKFAIKSSRCIVINASSELNNSSAGGFEVQTDGGSKIIMAMARCNGCYSGNAKINDAVIRGFTEGSLIISNDRTGDIKFETREVYPQLAKIQMVIDKYGNVGIGTGNNALAINEKLAVNGLIHTKEVKVDLQGWPDYVFNKEYYLPTLDEVEKQIKEKGHLANIPTAKEVEENGLLLGEINKKLLEKIEELTLYVIKINREVEMLKARK